MRALWLGLCLPLSLTACTGLTLGENKAGADTYLGYGSIAVDDRTETSFVLSNTLGTTDPNAPQILHGVAPDTGTVRTVADLTGRDDPRILFPSSGVLVMSESGGYDELRLLDQATFAPKLTVPTQARYHGTRMSPSRDWIAVADNTQTPSPIHILDAASLEAQVIPHGGDWLEAMWENQSDKLIAIVFENEAGPSPVARILRWTMSDVKTSNWQVGAHGCWSGADLDLALAGKKSDFGFSFTWVGISPDDHWAVFPVRDAATSAYELIVLDTTNGTTRTVENAKGPVGFTPDSATIVSYRDVDANGNQELLLVDAATLAVDPQTVPIQGGLSYFVSHEGNFIVVASSTGGERLVLYDVDHATSTQMQGPGIALDSFVSRLGHGELWLVDSQALFKLDMVAATFDPIATSFAPEHINLLPTRDRLVLDDANSTKLFFFDPEALATTLTVSLPTK